MKAYLLDTNICIYLIKQHPPEVLERFQQIKIQQLYIPTISAYDVQITAVALVEKMTLLTNSTREFERVEGLLLENWVD